LTNIQSLPTEEPSAPRDPLTPLPLTIAPIIEQAQRTFCSTLPQLLRERLGQWVAYHGDRQIGFARTKTELYQECFRQGLKRSELLVRCIEPEMDELTFGPGLTA
jgi:hypothetical protein